MLLFLTLMSLAQAFGDPRELLANEAACLVGLPLQDPLVELARAQSPDAIFGDGGEQTVLRYDTERVTGATITDWVSDDCFTAVSVPFSLVCDNGFEGEAFPRLPRKSKPGQTFDTTIRRDGEDYPVTFDARPRHRLGDGTRVSWKASSVQIDRPPPRCSQTLERLRTAWSDQQAEDEASLPLEPELAALGIEASDAKWIQTGEFARMENSWPEDPGVVGVDVFSRTALDDMSIEGGPSHHGVAGTHSDWTHEERNGIHHYHLNHLFPSTLQCFLTLHAAPVGAWVWMVQSFEPDLDAIAKRQAELKAIRAAQKADYERRKAVEQALANVAEPEEEQDIRLSVPGAFTSSWSSIEAGGTICMAGNLWEGATHSEIQREGDRKWESARWVAAKSAPRGHGAWSFTPYGMAFGDDCTYEGL